jgi:F-type H+-transporting ATPase subunit alpha
VYAAEKGYLDDLPVGKVLPFEKGLHDFFHQNYGDLMKKIVATGDWNNDIEASFKGGLDEFKKTGSW